MKYDSYHVVDDFKIHWFDLPAFYLAAAKVLKPGGTIAAWVTAPTQVGKFQPNLKI